MIANVSAHRRANAFAQALEEQSDRGSAAEQSEEPAPAPAGALQTERAQLLALTSDLGALPKPELDPEVKVVQRAQLVAAFEAMLQEGTAAGGATDQAVPEQRSRRGAHRATPLGRLRPRSRLAKGLTAGGLTLGVAAGALGGVAAASSDALPGDSLYGLKRGIEDVKLGLADGNDERGRVYLDHASTRLGEARRLMERDRSGPSTTSRSARSAAPCPACGTTPPRATGCCVRRTSATRSPWAPCRRSPPSPGPTGRPGAPCATGCPCSWGM
ncbi:hypothetical protein SHKM778_05720 [Streptomyces sp. KM77-8]|uniref:DUF5667 domain-containing protein n=1 Tax=Streptomyces haneummycinicus TaxID=3074435 RepID=A0AAT9HAA5_9ACTN